MAMDDEKLKSMAKHRAEFKQHLMVYVVVMCGLTAINAITSRVYWWVVWPALGWGIGIALHGLTVYGRLGDTLEEYDKIIDRTHQYFDRFDGAEFIANCKELQK